MSENLQRKISLIYDLLFGYTDKMKGLREGLEKGNFRLPVEIAMVIKINDYYSYAVRKSEFVLNELKRNVIVHLNQLAGKFSSDILSDFIEEDTLVLFFSADFINKRDSNYELTNFARYIKEGLEKDFPLKFYIGIGRKHDSLKGLIFSYKEALNACKNTYFIGEVEILHVDDIVKFNSDIPIFISEAENEFLEKVNAGNSKEINKFLEKILNVFVKERLEPEIIKMRIMELVFKLIKTVNEMGDGLENHFNEFSPYLEEILQVERKKELEKILNNLANKLVGIMNQDNNKREISMALNYINENYNHELSLSEVAQKVDLSLYYFSHLFKEEIGESFVTYLNKLRITKAKKMLKETSLNIAEISYKVGYNDPNYFTRVFKEYEEVTPSKYRKGMTDRN